MVIQKFEYLKTFEQDLKQQLGADKKYLPISRRWAALLRAVNPMITTTESTLKTLKEDFDHHNLLLNRAYLEFVENSQRSFKVLVDKNQDEVDKSHAGKTAKIQTLTQRYKEQLKGLDAKLEKAEGMHQEGLHKAEMLLKRELAVIQKTMLQIRHTHQENTTAIETEKKATLDHLNAQYEAAQIRLEEAYESFKEDIAADRLVIQEEGLDTAAANDETYLLIKNTYNELSIQFNKKVSGLKKAHNRALAEIEKTFKAKHKPLEKDIEQIRQSYQEKKIQIETDHVRKITELNTAFEQQKETYDQKKARIIHESGEAVTLLNSKLSAYREGIIHDKLETSKTMRDEMKTIAPGPDRDRMNHQLTKQLNSFDNELNKQIIRTQKDILLKQREMQRKLFLHDQDHLQNTNTWRLQHKLLEYGKKHEHNTLDMRYNLSMTVHQHRLKLLETDHAHHQDLLLLVHNNDVLKLETQLHLAAAVQERDLNTLANDAHLDIAGTRHHEAELDHKLKQKALTHDHALALLKLGHEDDQQVLNITIQLEIEKEKMKRDYGLQEQELRLEMNQLIRDKTALMLEDTLNQEEARLDTDKTLLLIDHNHTQDLVREEAERESDKRRFLSNEGRFRMQQRLSNEKAGRFLKVYRLELELMQSQSETFMALMHLLHAQRLSFKGLINELYVLPSHPEDFKAVLNLINDLLEKLEISTLELITFYQGLDEDFFKRKIDDLTSYKYMLKHEDMMNLFDTEIKKVQDQKAGMLEIINQMEGNMLMLQTNLEKEQAFIAQLMKISQGIKDQEIKSKDRTADIKENLKLISNHEHEVRRIQGELQRLEKDINARHRHIMPLNREIDKLDLRQQRAKSKLDLEKHREAAFFHRYLNKSQIIYKKLSRSLKEHTRASTQAYRLLTNEVYVTDTFLVQISKSINKADTLYETQLVGVQQALLDLMLSFYRQNELEQLAIMRGFQASTHSLITSLTHDYENTEKLHEQHAKEALLEKERQTKEHQDKLTKKLELINVTHQKHMAIKQRHLKATEDNITANNRKLTQELALLNDNQTAIAVQFENEHQAKTNQMEDTYQKGRHANEQAWQSLVKNLESLRESLANKNQVLLNRYEIQHEKVVLALKQKEENHYVSEQKAKEANALRHTQDEETLSKLAEKLESELKNMQDHYRRYVNETTKAQTRMFKKENRMLKKSQRFKLKMLNLN